MAVVAAASVGVAVGGLIVGLAKKALDSDSSNDKDRTQQIIDEERHRFDRRIELVLDQSRTQQREAHLKLQELQQSFQRQQERQRREQEERYRRKTTELEKKQQKKTEDLEKKFEHDRERMRNETRTTRDMLEQIKRNEIKQQRDNEDLKKKMMHKEKEHEKTCKELNDAKCSLQKVEQDQQLKREAKLQKKTAKEHEAKVHRVIKNSLRKFRLTREDWEYACVMDIGSSTTGLASCSRRDSKARVLPIGPRAEKTDTAILVDRHMNVEEFGLPAKDQFYSLGSEAEDYLLFSGFKMTLYKEMKAVNAQDIMIKATNGEHMPAIDLLSLTIQELKKKFMKETKKVCGSEPDITRVLWIITIPEIWGKPMKQLFRSAAIKAGLCTESHQDSLHLLFEAAAAAEFCSNLITAEFMDEDKRVDVRRTEAGDKMLIVDIGGGTVDVACLKKVNSDVCNTLNSKCGDYGGDRVNNHVLNVFENVVGGSNFSNWKEEHPQEFLNLSIEIERRKCAWDGRKNSKLTVDIPRRIVFDYEEAVNNAERVSRRLNGTVTCDGYAISISTDIVISFFRECTDGTVSLIKEMSIAQDLTVVYLVGGGAYSCFWRQELTTRLQSLFPSVPVLTPRDAGNAVMEGALVLKGLQSRGVSSRNSSVVEKTLFAVPVAERPLAASCCYSEIAEAARPIFCKGDQVSLGDYRYVEFDYTPEQLEAGFVRFKIYSTEEEAPRAVDPAHLETEIKLTFPQPEAPKLTSCSVVAVIEGVELYVYCVDNETGTFSAPIIEFL